MIRQEFEESRSSAVVGLHYSGRPEQDHLIDAIQHPETEEALEVMALRFAPPAAEPQPKTGVTW